MEVESGWATATLALLAAMGCGPNGTIYAEHEYSYFANPGEQCRSAESVKADGPGTFESVDSVTLRVEPWVLVGCCYTEVPPSTREVCVGAIDGRFVSDFPADQIPTCPDTDDRVQLVSPGPFQPGGRIVKNDKLKCIYTWKGQEKRT